MARIALFAAGAAVLIASFTSYTTPAPRRADRPVPQPPIIEARLAQDRPAPGFIPMELPGGDTVYVAEESVFSDDGIEHVRLDTTGRALLLDTRLSPAAADRLRVATARGLDTMLLALLIESRLLNAAPIKSALEGTLPISISVPIAPQSAEGRAIAARVAARWPQ